MDEVWVNISGSEGRYQVSNMGQVRTVWSKSNAKPRHGGGVLKQGRSIDGYSNVKLKGQTRRVHRLVAEHFCNMNPAQNEVNHINGKKSDNRSSNLEWCTRSENMRHALVNGLKPKLAKLSPQTVRVIKRLSQMGMKNNDIAEFFGVNRKTVYNALTGRTWSFANNRMEK